MTALTLRQWLLLGGASYLLFAIVSLPANVAIGLLAPEGATISGVTGSAWNGSANSVTTQAGTFTDVRWSLKPWKLLLLSASAEVNAKLPGGAIRTEVNSSLFSNKGKAKELRGVIKLEDMSPLLQLPLPLEGTAGLRFDELGWADGALVSATGEIQLAEITEPTSGTRLGNFSIVFSPADNDATNGVFSDTEAVIGLNGNLLLNADKTYSVNAVIEPNSGTPQALLSAITMFGARPDASGKYTLQSEGSY